MGKKFKVSLDTAERVIISEILANLYAGVPYNTVYLEGTMGIGKSSIYRSIVNFMSKLTGNQWGFCDLRFATLSASDIQGVPHPVQQSNGTWTMKWIKDDTMPGISENLPEYGIVLMDEINQVKEPAVKSIMYQFILDKKINDYKLPDTWYIGCAGNREEDGGIYDRLLAPVRDRMLILEAQVNPVETLNYFKKAGFHPTVISYIETNLANKINVLHTYNPELETAGDEKCENYVFCTPRTYEFVSNVLYSHEIMKQNNNEVSNYVTDDGVLKSRLCGLMGEKEGDKFFKLYKSMDRLDFNSIFDANWQNDKPDRALPTANETISGSDAAEFTMNIYNQVENLSIDKIKSLIKWLLYISADWVIIKQLYDKIKNIGGSSIKTELLDTQCNELLNRLEASVNRSDKIII